MSIFKLIIFIITSGLIYQANAQQVLTVATQDWKNYTQKDGKGYYFDIIRAIYEPLGIAIKIIYVPFNRSVIMVNNGNADLLFGAYKSDLIRGTFSDIPISITHIDAAISPELAVSWKGVESIKGKKVGSVVGYNMDQYIDFSIKYTEVAKLSSLIKMLSSGRIDVILDHEQEIYNTLKTLNIEPSFIIKKAVAKVETYAVFSQSKHAQAMLKLFDEGVVKMHKSGDLRLLMMHNVGTAKHYPSFAPQEQNTQ